MTNWCVMNEFRKGDKVKPRGEMIVTNIHAGYLEFEGTGYLPAHLFELVERPGPKLADLPDGTVITFDGEAEPRTPWEVMEDDRTLCWHGMLTTFDEATEDWTVIGAKPGTAAWPLFETGDPEWWAAS